MSNLNICYYYYYVLVAVLASTASGNARRSSTRHFPVIAVPHIQVGFSAHPLLYPLPSTPCALHVSCHLHPVHKKLIIYLHPPFYILYDFICSSALPPIYFTHIRARRLANCHLTHVALSSRHAAFNPRRLASIFSPA